VTGISWYEAAAFAEFASKSLPTGDHWGMARANGIGLSALMGPMSNFNGRGPEPVGKNQGISPFGAYDMAGNVREWCWNETSRGRLVRGGAWNDNYYMAGNLSQAPAFDRSPRNGFRCVRYLDREKIPEAVFEPVTLGEQIDLYEHEPVSEEVFRAYQRQFSYDQTDLDSRVEWRNESSGDWIQEKITFDAAYGDERVIAYLFLPKNQPPPHQTVIYFPGSTSAYLTSSENLEEYREFEWFLEAIVTDGRAVLYPVYKGTFERRDDFLTSIHGGDDSHAHTEYTVQLVKDFRRCVDYLETRQDIDSNKLAFLGMSWGGQMAPVILATEDRIKAAVLALGGTRARGLPEVNPVNYIPRVEVPTLMLNGRYDMTFQYETQVKPMFDLLGTPEEHKRSILYDTDHFTPWTDTTKETLAWLDRYLGPLP
jgi:dienelactone hydrolase